MRETWMPLGKVSCAAAAGHLKPLVAVAATALVARWPALVGAAGCAAGLKRTSTRVSCRSRVGAAADTAVSLSGHHLVGYIFIRVAEKLSTLLSSCFQMNFMDAVDLAVQMQLWIVSAQKDAVVVVVVKLWWTLKDSN